jgi:hypothetical protein
MVAMDDNENVLQLFEGLSTEAAQEFRRRIFPMLENLRNEVTNNQKGKYSMNENDNSLNWIDTLTEEEKQQIAKDLEASRQKIQAGREAKALAETRQRYEGERDAIMRAGLPLDTRLRRLGELKKKYPALGLV